MLFKFTAVTGVKCLKVPTNQLLNILSMPLLSHPCCNREEQSERRGFPQHSWPKTCFLVAKSHLLIAVHHPSAVLIQHFIINIIVRQFTAGIQAGAHPHSPGGTSEACWMQGWDGSRDSWGWACCCARVQCSDPGLTACSLVSCSLPGNDCECFPKVHSEFPRLFVAQHSLGECANSNVPLTVCRSWSQCWEI